MRAIFFAMVTLAVASAFAILAAQLSDITGGEDGRSFRVPEMLRPNVALVDLPVFGVDVTGRITLTYYLVFFASVALFLALHGSSTRRSDAYCWRSARTSSAPRRWATARVSYRTVANCLAAGWWRCSAGTLNAIWLRYTGPDTTLSFAIMIDILLMVVIGGMGTMYGAVIGATLFVWHRTTCRS